MDARLWITGARHWESRLLAIRTDLGSAY